jgi:hypothetical protein
LGAPAGGLAVLEWVTLGALLEVELVLDPLAALAIAAPPPATAAVTVPTVTIARSRWLMVLFTSL